MKALLAPIAHLAAMEAAIQALAFVFVIVKFRYFGAAFMGLIGYFGAIQEFPSSFYSHFNKALTRFVPTAEPRRRVEIFIASLAFQLVVAFVFLAAAAFLFLAAIQVPGVAFWRDQARIEGREAGFAAAFTVLLVVLNLLQGALGAMAMGLNRVHAVQAMKVAQILAQLLLLAPIFLLVEDRITGLRAYYSAMAGIASVSILYLLVLVERGAGLRAHADLLRPAAFRVAAVSVYREHFRTYSLPQQYTALLAYVKENLAVLLLGQTGSLAGAGIYNLANRLYTLPRRFVPTLMALMVPRMVLKVEKDRQGFRRRFDDFAWAQFAAYAALGTALFAGLPVIQGVFGVSDEPGLDMVFFLFSANLIINSIALANSFIIELGRDLRFLALSVTVRTVMITAMTFLLVPNFGSTGATAALVLSTVIHAAFLAWDTRGTDLWDWRQNYRQGIACLALIALWAAFFVIFPDTYQAGIGKG